MWSEKITSSTREMKLTTTDEGMKLQVYTQLDLVHLLILARGVEDKVLCDKLNIVGTTKIPSLSLGNERKGPKKERQQIKRQLASAFRAIRKKRRKQNQTHQN